MTYVLGDLHIRKEEPFFSAARDVLDHMKLILRPDDILIQVGDLFHTSKPFPKEYELVFSFLNWAQKNHIKTYLLAGNHDYHYSQGTYSIDPLKDYVEEIIYEPNIYNVDEEGTKVFFLPWQPIKNFKETVEKEYPQKFESQIKEANFLFYHFSDETIMFGSNYRGTDLRPFEKINPSIQRLGGDIHIQSPNFIGTPYQTRYDEKGQVGRYATLEKDKISYFDLPIFTSYQDIWYDEGFTLSKTEKYPILTIKKAPSIELAKDKYKEYHIRLVETIAGMDRVEAEEKELSSLNEALNDFLSTNKIDDNTKKYLREVVNI